MMQHIALEINAKKSIPKSYGRYYIRHIIYAIYMPKPKNSHSSKMNLIRMQSVSSKTELIMKWNRIWKNSSFKEKFQILMMSRLTSRHQSDDIMQLLRYKNRDNLHAIEATEKFLTNKLNFHKGRSYLIWLGRM